MPQLGCLYLFVNPHTVLGAQRQQKVPGYRVMPACPQSRVAVAIGTWASSRALGGCWGADEKVASLLQSDERHDRGRMRCSGGREEEPWIVLGG